MNRLVLLLTGYEATMPHLPKAIPSSGWIVCQVGLCLACVGLLAGSLVSISKPSVQIKTPIAVSSLPHPELSERRPQDNGKRADYVPSVSIKTQGRHDPRTVVPRIARLLGVRVGYIGQQAL